MSKINPFINTIEEMFEKEFSPEGKRTLQHRLVKFCDDVFIQAIKDIESAGLSWRPKWPEIVGYCERAEYNIKSKGAPIVEKVRPEKTDLQFNMFKIIIRMFRSGKHNRQEILDKIRHADSVDNSKGWHNTGMALEKHYKDYKEGGLDLSKPPSNHTSYGI